MTSDRNKTIKVENLDQETLYANVLIDVKDFQSIINKTIHWDSIELLKKIPDNSVDLIVTDPPYNLTKEYAGTKFAASSNEDYENWLELRIPELKRISKDNASVYICCDWKSSIPVYDIMSKYFTIINRITWEREKWRWASANWKNCIEDIYFWVVNDKHYTFNIDDVKIKRKVIAPYKTDDWEAKDWAEEKDWNFRLTMPSNVWTDISIPFWSMPENTTHPTQKPEKLIAKIILASSNKWDIILDPFLWSWTTSVVAKKLWRKYIWIEREKDYSIIAEHRLKLADNNKSIQWYEDWVFWERNTLQERQSKKAKEKTLFDC